MLALKRDEAAVAALQNAADRIDEAGQRSVVLFNTAEIQESRGKYSEALAVLKRIVDERPGTASAGKALLASADIYQKFLNDPKGALGVYRQIQNDPIVGHRRPEMLLQMADCYVRLDDLDDGGFHLRFGDPGGGGSGARGDGGLQAGRGRVSSAATSTLRWCSTRTWRRNTRVASWPTTPPGVTSCSTSTCWWVGGRRCSSSGRMEWGLLAGDSAAVDSSASLLIDNWSGGELAAEAHLGLADLAERSGRYPEAIEHLEGIVTGHPGATGARRRR